ncbi:MAG: hypothetical protein AB4911_22750 [Oscillochloridaceae bacterium umkhey_bin13]
MLELSNPQKYAQVERERRFLVAQVPFTPMATMAYADIIDTYLPSEQIRLRLMQRSNDSLPVYKITQKRRLPTLPPYAVMITTIYLTAEDYTLFRRLPGAVLHKRRYPWVDNGMRFAVDVFAGALEGLVLAEVEGASDAEVAGVVLPSFASREVSAEPVFRGGSLARLTSEEFQRWRASGYKEGRH